MATANAWSDSTVGSVSRMNLTGVISGTGDYLATLDYSKFKILICTETGSGFIVNHIYLCNADGLGVTDLSSFTAHTHSSSTDGGTLGDIYLNNVEYIDTGGLYMFNLLKSNWKEVVSGTGSTSESTSETGYTDQTVLKCSTGATSASTANLKKLGVTVNFSKSSYFAFTAAFSSTADLSSHWGYYVEKMADADDNVRKYGLSTCTATNGNWFIHTADGSAHSDSDTGTAFATSVDAFVVLHDPSAPNVKCYQNGTLTLTKTSNIPISTTTDTRDPLWQFGIKNSAASDKVATLYKLKFGYYTNDSDFGYSVL